MSASAPWSVHLVGAGVVGRAIAANHLEQGVSIELLDANSSALDDSVDWLRANTGCNVARRESWRGCGGRAQLFTRDGEPGHQSDQAIVIESIIEKPDLKQQLFAELSNEFDSRAILATNTSTIRLEEITQSVSNRNRCCGIHFFMPVTQRPLVEIIHNEHTSPETIQIAQAYAASIGKQNLVVADSPGFVVNRMLVPYLNESLHVLCSGASAEQIENTARVIGMPMSPLELMDWIGMETNVHAGRAIYMARKERFDPHPLMNPMRRRKRLGRQHGKGFYDYDGDRRSESLADETLELVKEYSRDHRDWTEDEIALRLFVPMLLEAAFILSERVIPNLGAIEKALRGGLGFHREEGLLGYFDSIEPKRMDQILAGLETLGRRYEGPADFRQSLAGGATIMNTLEKLVA